MVNILSKRNLAPPEILLLTSSGLTHLAAVLHGYQFNIQSLPTISTVSVVQTVIGGETGFISSFETDFR